MTRSADYVYNRPEMSVSKSNHPRLTEMATPELLARVAGYSAFARNAATPELRDAFDRLALRCARMAAERAAEERVLVWQWARAAGTGR